MHVPVASGSNSAPPPLLRPPSPTRSSGELSRRSNSPHPFIDTHLDAVDSDDDIFEFPQPPPDVDDPFQWEVDSDGHLPREPSIFRFSSDLEDDSLFPLDPLNSDDEQDANENGDVNIDDIETDPLFRSQASLFDRFQAGSEPEPEDDTEPWAFDDHPAIPVYLLYRRRAPFPHPLHRLQLNRPPLVATRSHISYSPQPLYLPRRTNGRSCGTHPHGRGTTSQPGRAPTPTCLRCTSWVSGRFCRGGEAIKYGALGLIGCVFSWC